MQLCDKKLRNLLKKPVFCQCEFSDFKENSIRIVLVLSLEEIVFKNVSQLTFLGK